MAKDRMTLKQNFVLQTYSADINNLFKNDLKEVNLRK